MLTVFLLNVEMYSINRTVLEFSMLFLPFRSVPTQIVLSWLHFNYKRHFVQYEVQLM